MRTNYSQSLQEEAQVPLWKKIGLKNRKKEENIDEMMDDDCQKTSLELQIIGMQRKQNELHKIKSKRQRQISYSNSAKTKVKKRETLVDQRVKVRFINESVYIERESEAAKKKENMVRMEKKLMSVLEQVSELKALIEKERKQSKQTLINLFNLFEENINLFRKQHEIKVIKQNVFLKEKIKKNDRQILELKEILNKNLSSSIPIRHPNVLKTEQVQSPRKQQNLNHTFALTYEQINAKHQLSEKKKKLRKIESYGEADKKKGEKQDKDFSEVKNQILQKKLNRFGREKKKEYSMPNEEEISSLKKRILALKSTIQQIQ